MLHDGSIQGADDSGSVRKRHAQPNKLRYRKRSRAERSRIKPTKGRMHQWRLKRPN